MKILVIDDSNFFRMFLIKILNEYIPGCHIVTAANGKEGFEVFQLENPDFVLTDLLMPETGGQELLKQIKKFNENAKIIVISADIQKATREEIEELGVQAFLNKPLNNEKAMQLITLIKEASNA